MWTTTRRGGGRWSCRNECKRRCSGDCKRLGIPYRKESPVPGTSAKVSTSSHSVYVKFTPMLNTLLPLLKLMSLRLFSFLEFLVQTVPKTNYSIIVCRLSVRNLATFCRRSCACHFPTIQSILHRMNSLSVEKGTISELKNAVNDVSKAAHRTFQHRAWNTPFLASTYFIMATLMKTLQ
ncbi:unnamed protein product, partial [Musa acuminata var. zebrina]